MVCRASTLPDQAQYAEMKGRVTTSMLSGRASTAPLSGSWKLSRLLVRGSVQLVRGLDLRGGFAREHFGDPLGDGHAQAGLAFVVAVAPQVHVLVAGHDEVSDLVAAGQVVHGIP